MHDRTRTSYLGKPAQPLTIVRSQSRSVFTTRPRVYFRRCAPFKIIPNGNSVTARPRPNGTLECRWHLAGASHPEERRGAASEGYKSLEQTRASTRRRGRFKLLRKACPHRAGLLIGLVGKDSQQDLGSNHVHVWLTSVDPVVGNGEFHQHSCELRRGLACVGLRGAVDQDGQIPKSKGDDLWLSQVEKVKPKQAPNAR